MEEDHSLVNKNVNWLGSRFFAFYAFVLFLGYFLCSVILVRGIKIFDKNEAYSFVNIVHGLVNFLVMHQLTGSPGELGDQGEYYDIAWWDQLDDGIPWTTSKKFLILIPVIMYLGTIIATEFHTLHFIANTAILFLVLAPKLPLFKGFRFNRSRLSSKDKLN